MAIRMHYRKGQGNHRSFGVGAKLWIRRLRWATQRSTAFKLSLLDSDFPILAMAASMTFALAKPVAALVAAAPAKAQAKVSALAPLAPKMAVAPVSNAQAASSFMIWTPTNNKCAPHRFWPCC